MTFFQVGEICVTWRSSSVALVSYQEREFGARTCAHIVSIEWLNIKKKMTLEGACGIYES